VSLFHNLVFDPILLEEAEDTHFRTNCTAALEDANPVPDDPSLASSSAIGQQYSPSRPGLSAVKRVQALDVLESVNLLFAVVVACCR
jgi:hypothetical protein